MVARARTGVVCAAPEARARRRDLGRVARRGRLALCALGVELEARPVFASGREKLGGQSSSVPSFPHLSVGAWETAHRPRSSMGPSASSGSAQSSSFHSGLAQATHSSRCTPRFRYERLAASAVPDFVGGLSQSAFAIPAHPRTAGAPTISRRDELLRAPPLEGPSALWCRVLVRRSARPRAPSSVRAPGLEGKSRRAARRCML